MLPGWPKYSCSQNFTPEAPHLRLEVKRSGWKTELGNATSGVVAGSVELDKLLSTNKERRNNAFSTAFAES
jgi:hypothetical protein